MSISKKDLLTPYPEFEQKHDIKDTRHDMPYAYLGISPSKYYRTIDMNVEELGKKVGKMFRKFSRQNPR